MGVLRTNESGFEDQANENSYVTDQHYNFSIPSRGSSSYFPILPKNYALSQVLQDEIVHTISHDDEDIGVLQVFQATVDNINGIKFVGTASHSETENTEIIDACEYATDAEVRANWTVLVAEHDKKIELKSTDDEVNGGAYAIKIKCESKAEGNYLKKTFAEAQDWSDLDAICFYWNSDKYGGNYRWKIVITDNINQECYYSFNALARYTWEHKHFSKNLFFNHAVIDFSQIVSFRFECEETSCTYYSYLDDFQIIRNIEQRKVNAEVSLYHFGPTPDFSTLGDLQTLDDGFPSEDTLFEIDVKRISPCVMNYGSLKNDRKLTKGDYYGILIRRPDEGSIKLYGTPTQVFPSGNVYDVASDETMTALDKSLAFMMCTFSDSTVTKICIKQDVHNSDSNINLLLMDPIDFTIVQFLGVYTFERCDEIKIEYDYSNPELINLTQNKHLYVYYQDGVSSTANKLIVDARFHYSDVGE